MSDEEDRSPSPKPSKYGALNFLTKVPLVPNSDEIQPSDEIAAIFHTNADQDNDKTKMKTTSDTDLSRPTTPKKSSLNNSTNSHNNNNGPNAFNNDDIQRKMSGVIHKLQSRSTTPEKSSSLLSPNERSLSDTENLNSHLITSKNTKTTADQHRQNSFSIEQTTSADSTLDGDFLNSKTTITSQEDRPSSSRSKKSGLDETRRFGVVSPKPTGSRAQSPRIQEQPLPSSSRSNSRLSKDDRKSPSMNSSTAKIDDHQQQKSQTSPRDPISTNAEQEKQLFKPPNAVASPASRRDSTNRNDQQASSRPGSHQKNDSFGSNDRLKLIKPGEQLQLPTNTMDSEQLKSPPPVPLGNSSTVNNDQDYSRPPSTTNRKNSNSNIQNKEKIITDDVTSMKSRRSSNTSQQQRTNPTDQKPISRKGSNASERQVPSRKQSDAHEEKPTGRQSVSEQHEEKPPSKVASRKNSSTSQPHILSRRESQQQADTSRENNSCQESTIPVSSSQQSSRRASLANQPQPISMTGKKRDVQSPSSDTDDARRKSAQQKQERILSNNKRRSPSQRISSQQSRKDPNSKIAVTPTETNSAKIRSQQGKRLSTTDSDQDHPNPSKLPLVHKSSRATTPTDNEQPNQWIKKGDVPSMDTTDNDDPSSKQDQARPKSPTTQQINDRNPIEIIKKGKPTDGQKKKEPQRPLLRSTSAESFNYIRIVDDKSIDSTSDVDNQKRRPIRSKKKDTETNTEPTTDGKTPFRDRSQISHQQQGPTSQKVTKAGKPISNQARSTHRRAHADEPLASDAGKTMKQHSAKQSAESTDDQDPVTVNVTVLVKKYTGDNDDETPSTNKTRENTEVNSQRLVKQSTDYDRNTQSDTEQIITEKQKKRRRPKRISRTCQTYEHIFRRMERDQHDELRPTEDTEKCIQTRKSQLRPRTKSPKKHHPISLSTDAFNIEELLPKQFPHSQRNMSKTSVTARSVEPQGGKLLILRPTLPLHHTDAVNVQRICLQYAIDLIPNDSHSNRTNKFPPPKPFEQSNHLPMIRSSSSASATAAVAAANNTPTNRFPMKDKANNNKNPTRPYQQRRTDGAV